MVILTDLNNLKWIEAKEISLNSFCIATWNLDNMPLEGARANACRSKIAEIQAQVWVLTEFREGFNLGEDFRLVAESQPATDLATDRRWTGIWAHKSLFGSKEPTSDPERTVCARFKIFDSFIIFVYGTVLPWLGSEWKGNKSEGGQAFSQALDMQKNDWSALRDDHPEAWLCVAGDFNQDLLETGHYYGSKNGRKALKESLEYANLTCFTGGKTDPVRKYDSEKANIDHICLGWPAREHKLSAIVNAWPPIHNEIALSDHFGVSVAFDHPNG